ncbi:hypothetical protein B0H13DRAFT_2293178 [Mycena leptocephala]|nr:hypothetical protein B0H13DRAFT_2293178 [Mycena leptocephala]
MDDGIQGMPRTAFECSRAALLDIRRIRSLRNEASAPVSPRAVPRGDGRIGFGVEAKGRRAWRRRDVDPNSFGGSGASPHDAAWSMESDSREEFRDPLLSNDALRDSSARATRSLRREGRWYRIFPTNINRMEWDRIGDGPKFECGKCGGINLDRNYGLTCRSLSGELPLSVPEVELKEREIADTDSGVNAPKILMAAKDYQIWRRISYI